SAGRPLTGRMVLIMLLGFFGLVIAVNLVMVREAISTFGGVDTPSSYQAGLDFKAEERAVAAQDALRWRVDARLHRSDQGETVATPGIDPEANPFPGLAANARFANPADERRDVPVALRETVRGPYAGVAVVGSGQWTFDVVIGRAGNRLFHST